MKKHPRAPLAFAALAGLVAAMTGCAPEFEHLDLAGQTSPPLAAVVSYAKVEIPVGIAVGFTARPMDGNKELDRETVVELQADASGVVGVAPALDPRSFVIFGKIEGQGTIRVLVDGVEQATIPVTVTAQ